MPDDPELLAFVRAALAGIDALHVRVVEAIGAEEDPDTALRIAGEYASHVRYLGDVASELRTRIAGQIWETEKLSLAKLADRVGVSKSRADQIVKTIKKQQAEGKDR